MLKVFLRKWRAKRRDKEVERILDQAEQVGRSVNEVVDTVLAKLYTSDGETTDLLALIDGPNDIVLEEVEILLALSNRYDALCRLYKARGEEVKMMKIWSRCVKRQLCLPNALWHFARLVAGEIVDEDVRDPLESMFTFLVEKKDQRLSQEWGVWLLKWEPERALKVWDHLF
jgi:vacuolar protein sorting-associated protein 3